MPTAAAVASALSAMGAAPGAGAMDDYDSHLPRWRRPSLLEIPQGGSQPGWRRLAAISLKFTGDGNAAVNSTGCVGTSGLVSLLDVPDEIQGREIGSLDAGDEVVLLEKGGTYWRVLCPDGKQGWLHKMTLGDTVIDPSTQAGGTSTIRATTGRSSAGSRT